MRSAAIPLPPTSPGTTRALTVQRFGPPGARPRVHIQASLHADEIPAMLVADRLRRRLSALEADGKLIGEVVLIPVANPIGLSQTVLGEAVGRFDLADGKNFNRDFPALTEAVADRLAKQPDGQLDDDAAANADRIRAALDAELAARRPLTAAVHLKRELLALAVQADVTLDLHCDSEAVMHLYTMPASTALFDPLVRLLKVQAVFLATLSGDDPFDEAVSRPWHELRERWPDRAIPFGGHAATVELRGQADVDADMADGDAEAIVGFLAHLGVIDAPPPPLPEPLCAPTPLESSEPLVAPVGGVLVFRQAVGDRVAAGTVIADIIDPIDGAVTPVPVSSAGLLYARIATRFVTPGKRFAKVAGTDLRRSGPLLSP